MPIVPDDKNWTWVLERPCGECGFVAETFDPADAPALLIANGARWRGLLAHPKVAVRPNDEKWSALEYACHVRDVFRLYLYRLNLMMSEEGPHFPNWDQDETALTNRYSEQDAKVVADEIEVAAADLAAGFAKVKVSDYERTGFRSDGAAFTIGSFARYLAHDPVHHVWDVEQTFVANDSH